MILAEGSDLFKLIGHESVSKRNLYDLVQYSKIQSSPYWGGAEFLIGNTPQQGINWIGEFPALSGVIVKVRPGSYEGDGWADSDEMTYHYSFKARSKIISYTEKANQALINQPQHLYPIFLFTDAGKEWSFEGRFLVSEIMDTYVILQRDKKVFVGADISQVEQYYEEGGKRYVTHLMAERSAAVVAAVKASADWVCEICAIDFESLYAFPYIEAHHKTAISTYESSQKVKPSDLALLCPNCHAAVHLYMKNTQFDYFAIKEALIKRLQKITG